jgi:hypothetical protein
MQYVECGQPLARNGKFCNLTCCNRENARRQKIKAEQRRQAKELAYNQNPKPCLECQISIPWAMTLNGPAKFCGHSCATKFNNRLRSKESRQKQRETLKHSIAQQGVRIRKSPKRKQRIKRIQKYKFCPIDWKICEVTGRPYHTRLKRGHRQTSPYVKDIKQIYYQLSSFKFNVYKMPKLFDLAILNTHGWYSCPGKKRKNLQKNTEGLSRDHRYSVSQGFVSRIHPLILSHPANCNLLHHKVNKTKHSKCSISLVELIENIKSFDNETHQFGRHQLIIDIINNGHIYVHDFESLRKLI